MDTAEIFKKVRKIEIKTGRLVNEVFAGEYQSAFKGRGIEFAEVREYVPGDDVRDIDWNVTARFSKPFIKKYSEERELNLMILCDISGSQFFGSRQTLKNELSAEIAATFAFSALKNGDKIGLLLFSDITELYIPPRKGKNHSLRIIRELLAFNPKNKKTSLSCGIDEINRLLKRNSIIILISDFIDTNFEKSLRLAKIKHDIIPVIVYDEMEINLPRARFIVEAENIETEEDVLLDLSDNLFRREFSRINLRRIEQVEEKFKKMGIDYLKLKTGEEFHGELVKFFKRREIKRWR